MKNAKEHASDFMELYKDASKFGGDEKKALITTVILICQNLIAEVKEIGLMRKAHCDSAWKAIIKEQNRKWVAIVRRLDFDRLVLIPQSDAFQTVWEHFKNEINKNG